MYMNDAAAFIKQPALHSKYRCIWRVGVACSAIDSCEAMCAFPLADSKQPHHREGGGGGRGGPKVQHRPD